ncbi:TetR/AcrR family transcriptional regulator [Mycolicibacterium monacense]|uniref:HTH tetR-type domain-containing protein n=1 Tax=Mycolicibacterium monacense TaxID=85693 RepID=A0AAD1MY26_MYCMB|nr:TetR/AcrR family transcriptional regulator [Mycolicibacterium monacense]MDA4104734.1 TetR family transcriptional regulator [Mycolicibacterium monacense DSM 44395]ORB22758.1 TetR family transcriptional regulator [Mycolicibacterium monacense DSM 44395]QHP87646.1 TetR/AcrR family transcriptional regulator [Mycolicibacterium monacense DSM 44395]BBZ59196.1 hypothetical protein MMON_04970 [Mycolicibacterium monacense]
MTKVTPLGDGLRRPGYAPPASTAVGRRGLHTRDRIVTCAAEVFLSQGFHSTSIDTIAKAAGASRAAIYQYFAGKEDIFGELSRMAERAALEHAGQLGRLGPTADGLANLRRWLHEWADVYDAHAAVFAEFPGIGTATGLSVIDAGSVTEKFGDRVAGRLLASPAPGLEHDDALAALMRIPHMVNLYRHRGMFPLPSREGVSDSLAIALQLMLYPDTPVDIICAAFPDRSGGSAAPPTAVAPVDGAVESAGDLSPVRRDVLAASSQLFAEHGYYAVSMQDIAAAAGISRATLYRYFSTKDRVLAELTRRAVIETAGHAAALHGFAGEQFDADRFRRWMLDYVRFHRSYRGVIRAWFDGTVSEQLSDTSIAHGIGSMHGAVSTLLRTATLPPGMDPAVAAAVFLATLGRMTEPTDRDLDTDQHAAELMVMLIRRSLLRAA